MSQMKFRVEIRYVFVCLLLLFPLSGVASLSQETNQDVDHAGPISGGGAGFVQLPEVPTIYRNVSGIIDTEHTRSHIPPMRLSVDGRLGTSSRAHENFLALYLLLPEQVQKQFVNEKKGVYSIMNEDPAYSIPYSELGLNEFLGFKFVSLCEADRLKENTPQNPYVCGDGNNDDCYDVTIVGGANITPTILENYAYTGLTEDDLGGNTRDILMSIPITVRVANPKTVNANIAEVEIHKDQIRIAKKSAQTSLFEPITPADGRLLIIRTDGQSLTWFNENTGEYEQGFYDVIYSVADEAAPACDARQWDHFYPISHAPYDMNVNTRYDFASRPFRDPMGHVIEDGAEVKGTYPWIDSGAKNLTMTMVPTALYDAYMSDPNNTTARYPTRCVVEGCDRHGLADIEVGTINDMGLVVFGSWTLGKMVLLDGLLNEMDFKLGPDNEEHSYVQLYAPNTGLIGEETGEVRMGGSRATGNEYPPSSFPFGSGLNLTMFDSVEARFNYVEKMKPVTPRDVVWLASSGRHTDEFAFDDYLHPDGFIVSNMVGAIDATIGSKVMATYYDGWNSEDQDFSKPVYIQNSATAERKRWHIPTHGEVSNGRLEPAAVGGVRGKGLWFNGGDGALTYEVPPQPRRVDAYPWYIHLFIDPRFPESQLIEERLLIEFPDQSQITLLGDSKLRYRAVDGGVVNEITLPKIVANKAWTSLGFEVRPGGRVIRFYHNGFPTQDFRISDDKNGIFQLVTGQLKLGHTTSSTGIKPFKGWMDEFKVFAQGVTEELACNHAMGTLAGITKDYKGTKWREVANQYNALQHGMVRHALQAKSYSQTYEQYVCHADYSRDYAAHLFNIPNGMIGLASALHFPEGPLLHDAPRPDSSYNEFCLSCHTVESKGGLKRSALLLEQRVTAAIDPRRQPLQPSARIFGNIPAHWLPNSPQSSVQLDSDGALIDRWLLESAEGKEPEVLGITVVNANTGEDLFAISDGMVIDLSKLTTSNVAIRAVSNGLTRDVLFEFDDKQSVQQRAPFALHGTNQGQFNSSELKSGQHTLTAVALGSGVDAIRVVFTVTGEYPLLVEGDTENAQTPVDYGLRYADGVVANLLDYFRATIAFFQSVGDVITQKILNAISSFYDLIQHNNESFESSGMSLFIDKAVRDGDTVLIEGRLQGPQNVELSINETWVGLDDGKFQYHIIDANTDRYVVQAVNSIGDIEETVIGFSKQRIANGLTVTLEDGSSLLRYATETINTEFSGLLDGLSGAINGEVSQLLAPIHKDLGVLVIDIRPVITVDNLLLESIQSGDQQDFSRLNITALTIADLDAGFPTTFEICIPYWWFGWYRNCFANFESTIQVNTDQFRFGVQGSLKKYEGDNFQKVITFEDVIDAQARVSNLDISIGNIPEVFIQPLEFVVNITHDLIDVLLGVDSMVANALLQSFKTPELIAQIDDTLGSLVFSETGRFISTSLIERSNLYPHNEVFPYPEFLKPYLDAYVLSTGVQIELNHMATLESKNIVSIDANWLSTSADNHVNFGYREIVGKSDSDYTIPYFDNMPSPPGFEGEVSLFFRGQWLNQFYAALAQEHFMDTVNVINVDALIDINKLVDIARDDPNISDELDVLLHEETVDVVLQESTELPSSMMGELTIRVASAPYLELPENPETLIALRVDNVKVSIKTLRDTYDKLDGTEAQLIAEASFDVMAELDFDIDGGNVTSALRASSVNLVNADFLGLDFPMELQKVLISEILKHHLVGMLDGITIYKGLSKIPGGGKLNAHAWRPDPDSVDIAVSIGVE